MNGKLIFRTKHNNTIFKSQNFLQKHSKANYSKFLPDNQSKTDIFLLDILDKLQS